eukprot:augustus_masked-scaffold_5-processed-gene-10.44-mRNA-1 protein AED:1.00 eAED:1.00 QI:0/-1/0/0/-1/1/1/0/825
MGTGNSKKAAKSQVATDAPPLSNEVRSSTASLGLVGRDEASALVKSQKVNTADSVRTSSSSDFSGMGALGEGRQSRKPTRSEKKALSLSRHRKDGAMSAANPKHSSPRKSKKKTEADEYRQSLLDRPKEGGESKIRTFSESGLKGMELPPAARANKRIASAMNPRDLKKTMRDMSGAIDSISPRVTSKAPDSTSTVPLDHLVNNKKDRSSTKQKKNRTSTKKKKHTSTTRKKHTSTTRKKHTSTNRANRTSSKKSKHTSTKLKEISRTEESVESGTSQNSPKKKKREKSRRPSKVDPSDEEAAVNRVVSPRASRKKRRQSTTKQKDPNRVSAKKNRSKSRKSSKATLKPLENIEGDESKQAETKAEPSMDVVANMDKLLEPESSPILDSVQKGNDNLDSKPAEVEEAKAQSENGEEAASPKPKKNITGRLSGLFRRNSTTQGSTQLSQLENNEKKKRKLSLRLSNAVRRLSFSGKKGSSQFSEASEPVSKETTGESLDKDFAAINENLADAGVSGEEKVKNKRGSFVGNRMSQGFQTMKGKMFGSDGTKAEGGAFGFSNIASPRKESNVLRYQATSDFLNDNRNGEKEVLPKKMNAASTPEINESRRDTLDDLESQALLEVEDKKVKKKPKKKKTNRTVPGSRDTLDMLEIQALNEEGLPPVLNGSSTTQNKMSRRPVPSILVSKSVTQLSLSQETVEQAAQVEKEERKEREQRRKELAEKKAGSPSKAKSRRQSSNMQSKVSRHSSTHQPKKNRQSSKLSAKSSSSKKGIPKKTLQAKKTERNRKVKSFAPEPGFLKQKKNAYLTGQPRNKSKVGLQRLGPGDY